MFRRAKKGFGRSAGVKKTQKPAANRPKFGGRLIIEEKEPENTVTVQEPEMVPIVVDESVDIVTETVQSEDNISDESCTMEHVVEDIPVAKEPMETIEQIDEPVEKEEMKPICEPAPELRYDIEYIIIEDICTYSVTQEDIEICEMAETLYPLVLGIVSNRPKKFGLLLKLFQEGTRHIKKATIAYFAELVLNGSMFNNLYTFLVKDSAQTKIFNCLFNEMFGEDEYCEKFLNMILQRIGKYCTVPFPQEYFDTLSVLTSVCRFAGFVAAAMMNDKFIRRDSAFTMENDCIIGRILSWIPLPNLRYLGAGPLSMMIDKNPARKSMRNLTDDKRQREDFFRRISTSVRNVFHAIVETDIGRLMFIEWIGDVIDLNIDRTKMQYDPFKVCGDSFFYSLSGVLACILAKVNTGRITSAFITQDFCSFNTVQEKTNDSFYECDWRSQVFAAYTRISSIGLLSSWDYHMQMSSAVNRPGISQQQRDALIWNLELNTFGVVLVADCVDSVQNSFLPLVFRMISQGHEIALRQMPDFLVKDVAKLTLLVYTLFKKFNCDAGIFYGFVDKFLNDTPYVTLHDRLEIAKTLPIVAKLVIPHVLVQPILKACLEIYVAVEEFEPFLKFRARTPLNEALKSIMSKYPKDVQSAFNDIDPREFINCLLNDSGYMIEEAIGGFKRLRNGASSAATRSTEDVPDFMPSADHMQRNEDDENEPSLEDTITKILRHSDVTLEYLSLLLYAVKATDVFLTGEVGAGVVSQLLYTCKSYFELLESHNTVLDQRSMSNTRSKFVDIVIAVIGLISVIYNRSKQLEQEEKVLEFIVIDDRSFSEDMFARLSASTFVPSSFSRLYDALVTYIAKRDKCDINQLVQSHGIEVPFNYYDLLTMLVMEDPVQLPTGEIVDRQTITRILLTKKENPFNRQPLHEEDLVGLTDLKNEISAWKEEQISNFS
ncbi:hypothetical protein PCE1_002990 [Barthelona sp. PCE]